MTSLYFITRNFFDNFGASSTENGIFWNRYFTINNIFFLVILGLLVWGLFAYLKSRKENDIADRKFKRDLDRFKSDREKALASMRKINYEDDDIKYSEKINSIDTIDEIDTVDTPIFLEKEKKD